jgi:heterodisulfide reductase subunit A2
MTPETVKADALVIGGGITGLQSAIDLADQGYHIALVERQPSIGGKMIMLSKVFPTLDCCSCITTPRMAAAAHHPNIEILAYSEVQSLDRNGNGFVARVVKKPRYVNESACTGCRECEYACPVHLPDGFDYNMGGHASIYVPFSTAMPQKALIDIDHCLFCGKCEKACPAEAIDFTQEAEEVDLEVETIVLATGFETTPVDAKKEYGAGQFRNVVHGMQVERMLAPTGPFGHVLRPSDGMQPDSIAYVQCAGSRDETLGVPYCSRVCCMYAVKQAMLLSGSLPLADITIYYMDMRTFGKGYEQFYQNAKAMGIEFVKGKVARITEDEDQNPMVRVELIDEGRVVERQHDMVVLSVGMVPGDNAQATFGVPVGDDGFIHLSDPNISPCLTDVPGIFAAGTATGPMDIVDSIVSAGAAAAEAAAYLEAHRQPAVISSNGPAMAAERSISYA